MNDHDQDLIHDINRVLDEGQPAASEFLNKLARTQPVASSKTKARIEDRLMSGLAERKGEKVKANGHFESNMIESDQPTHTPRRRTRQRLPLTLAATLLIVLFAGLILVLIGGEQPRHGGGQSQSELLTVSPTSTVADFPIILDSTPLVIVTPVPPSISANNLVAVVVAREDLAAGTVLSRGNVAVVYYPRDLFPFGGLSEPVLAYGRPISQDVAQYVPILMTPSLNDAATPFEIQVDPTECPPIVHSSSGVVADVQSATELRLNGVFPEPVEVVVMGYITFQFESTGRCPIYAEPFGIQLQVNVPGFRDMSNDEVIESIVYAFPASYLPNVPIGDTRRTVDNITVTIGEDTSGISWTIDLLDLRNARQADLHGDELMAALGLGNVSSTVQGQEPTVVRTIAPTPTECPPSVLSDLANNANDAVEAALHDILPETVEVRVSGGELTAAGPCPGNEGPFRIDYQITTPPIEGMTNEAVVEAIIYAFPEEQLVVNNELQTDGQLIIVIESEGASRRWQLSLHDLADMRRRELRGANLMAEADDQFVECPSPSLLANHLDNAQSAVEFGLYHALGEQVEVSVQGSPSRYTSSCPENEGPFWINFRITVPAIEGRSNEDILETIIYTFPSPQLPVNNALVNDGDLTITIGEGRDAPRWRINLVYLTVVIRRGLHGAELIAELEDLSGASNIQPTATPVPQDSAPDSSQACLSHDEQQEIFGVVGEPIEAALQTPVGVYISTVEDCVTAQDRWLVNYSISALDIDTSIPTADIIDTIVYAFPAEYLSDQPLPNVGGYIFISVPDGGSIGGASSRTTVYDLYNVRQQGLHGRVLLDALGYDMLSNAPSVFLPVSQDISDAVTVGEAVAAEIFFDVYAACFAVDDLPEAVQRFCQVYSRDAAEDGLIGIYETPLLAVAGTARVNGTSNLVVRADSMTAEIINWLQDQEAIERLTVSGVDGQVSAFMGQNQVALAIPIRPELAETLRVGETVTLEFVSDSRTICDAEDVIEIVEQWWRCIPVPQNDTFSTRIPFVVDAVTLAENQPIVTFTTNDPTATLITWLLAHNIDYRLIAPPADIEQPDSTTRAIIPVPQSVVEQFVVGDHVTAIFRIDDATVCSETAPANLQNLCRDGNIDSDGRHVLQTSTLLILGLHPDSNQSTFTVQVDAGFIDTFRTLLDRQAIYSLRIHEGEVTAAHDLQPDQVRVEIPIWPELAETLRVGDRLTVRFAGADFDTVCNPAESVPELIQEECESSFRSFNTRTIAFTAPSLEVSALNTIEGMTTVALAADLETAQAINWLQERGVVHTVRLNRDLEANTVWITAECPTTDLIQSALDSAEANLQTILEDSFDGNVEVGINGVAFCPDLSTPFDIWYRVTLSPTADLPHAEIIQTVVYAIPDDMLPQGIFTQSFDGITIVIADGENTREYVINFTMLKTARDRGFGGQALMGALGVEVTVD